MCSRVIKVFENISLGNVREIIRPLKNYTNSIITRRIKGRVVNMSYPLYPFFPS